LLRADTMAGTPGPGKPEAPGEVKLPEAAVGRPARARVPPAKASFLGVMDGMGPLMGAVVCVCVTH